MAITSTMAYIINEEEDGFVAVDFDIVSGSDDELMDLSSWELIDRSSSSSTDEDCSIGGMDDDLSGSDDKHVDFTGSLLSGVLWECLAERNVGDDLKLFPDSSPSSGVSSPESIVGHHQFPAVGGDVMTYRPSGENYYEEEDREEQQQEEEEEEDDEDDYDLDDELIPYSVNCKFGRERMRKLGKRACAKSIKTKRLTYNYNKAGCVRGKHGLGLKHSLI